MGSSALAAQRGIDQLKRLPYLLTVAVLFPLREIRVRRRDLSPPASNEFGRDRQAPVVTGDALRVQVALPMRPPLVFESSECLKKVLAAQDRRRALFEGAQIKSALRGLGPSSAARER
jgi:hypothetical protein